MALSQHLPIYKLARDLTGLAVSLTRNMPRDLKRTLGDRVLDQCFDMSLLIFRANVAQGTDRLGHIQQLLERNQVTELTLRLCVDHRLISTKQYANAIEITDQIGKQATGWKKQTAAAPVA
ncbi:MAG: four helix bundle protein [Ectopseudomonas guguanensis]|uniref:four helix bundle protein n=1 Tax=Ectopseudomonas guguanensis TaxID=1198456 RepID=UPI00391A922D